MKKKPGVRCVVCGRLLRSEKSKAAGVGRDCARKKRHSVLSSRYSIMNGREPMPDNEALETIKRVAGL